MGNHLKQYNLKDKTQYWWQCDIMMYVTKITWKDKALISNTTQVVNPLALELNACCDVQETGI